MCSSDLICETSGMRDREAGERVIGAALKHFGRVDIVIVNAGTNPRKPFADSTWAEYDEILQTHMDGAWSLLQAAWPHLVKQHYGRIVVTSSASFLGAMDDVHYSMAKASMLGLTRGLHVEGIECGIKTNALLPGAFTQLLVRTPTNSDKYDWIKENLRPEYVAALVAWLSHEDCSVSGETLMSIGKHICRAFVGFTEGTTVELPPTPETINEHFSDIFSPHRYDILDSAADILSRL